MRCLTRRPGSNSRSQYCRKRCAAKKHGRSIASQSPIPNLQRPNCPVPRSRPLASYMQRASIGAPARDQPSRKAVVGGPAPTTTRPLWSVRARDRDKAGGEMQADSPQLLPTPNSNLESTASPPRSGVSFNRRGFSRWFQSWNSQGRSPVLPRARRGLARCRGRRLAPACSRRLSPARPAVRVR